MSREIRVVAALIEATPGRFLVQQRLPGKSRALLWEFPGGKVESGETDAQALVREAREELGVRLEVGEERFSVRHAYQDLTVDLHLYAARIVEGTPAPLGAHALRMATRGGDAGHAILRGGPAVAPAARVGGGGQAARVIRRTLQLVPGIGPWREKDAWARGLETWDTVRTGGAAVLGKKLHAELLAGIERTEEALDRSDLAALARLVPAREHWRLWPLVADEALCLDIEADGVGERQRPTVAGCLDAHGLATFIDGRNLRRAARNGWASARVWVTFNGASFDLPVLRHAFPGLPGRCSTWTSSRSAGASVWGAGSSRPRTGWGSPGLRHLRGRSGMDAVLLWRAYHATGDIEALRFLVEYNLYDAFQLRAVADHAFNRAAERLHWPDRVVPWDRGVVLYDLSRLLLALEPSAHDLARAESLRALET